MSTYLTTDAAAHDIVRIVEDEARNAGLEAVIENHSKRTIANELVVAIKHSGPSFRITMQWVRDEHRDRVGLGFGWAYIETEWDLKLESQTRRVPAEPPFCWRISPSDRSDRTTPHPDILDEPWLRKLIRSKLASQQ